jgi:hypothetical protein
VLQYALQKDLVAQVGLLFTVAYHVQFLLTAG